MNQYLLKVFLTPGMIGTIIAIVRNALKNEPPMNQVLMAWAGSVTGALILIRFRRRQSPR